jgi:excisionase family DNA binding protein
VGDVGDTADRKPQPRLGVTEAAERLFITERQLRALCRREEVPHYRIGRNLRFDEIELEEYLVARKRGVAS